MLQFTPFSSINFFTDSSLWLWPPTISSAGWLTAVQNLDHIRKWRSKIHLSILATFEETWNSRCSVTLGQQVGKIITNKLASQAVVHNVSQSLFLLVVYCTVHHLIQSKFVSSVANGTICKPLLFCGAFILRGDYIKVDGVRWLLPFSPFPQRSTLSRLLPCLLKSSNSCVKVHQKSSNTRGGGGGGVFALYIYVCMYRTRPLLCCQNHWQVRINHSIRRQMNEVKIYCTWSVKNLDKSLWLYGEIVWSRGHLLLAAAAAR